MGKNPRRTKQGPALDKRLYAALKNDDTKPFEELLEKDGKQKFRAFVSMFNETEETNLGPRFQTLMPENRLVSLCFVKTDGGRKACWKMLELLAANGAPLQDWRFKSLLNAAEKPEEQTAAFRLLTKYGADLLAPPFFNPGRRALIEDPSPAWVAEASSLYRAAMKTDNAELLEEAYKYFTEEYDFDSSRLFEESEAPETEQAQQAVQKLLFGAGGCGFAAVEEVERKKMTPEEARKRLKEALSDKLYLCNMSVRLAAPECYLKLLTLGADPSKRFRSPEDGKNKLCAAQYALFSAAHACSSLMLRAADFGLGLDAQGKLAATPESVHDERLNRQEAFLGRIAAAGAGLAGAEAAGYIIKLLDAGRRAAESGGAERRDSFDYFMNPQDAAGAVWILLKYYGEEAAAGSAARKALEGHLDWISDAWQKEEGEEGRYFAACIDFCRLKLERGSAERGGGEAEAAPAFDYAL